MQDFTGVPAVVDLAAMRQAMQELGGEPAQINPLSPVDLVIDHSVQVDAFGNPRAFQINVEREYERNGERYAFLRWGAQAFDDFRVVPPGTGICHQVNLEYLGQVVWTATDGNRQLAFPDTLVGTDSHTTMINGLGVLGWGVGGIEAEAAMLGQPVSMVIPEVIGFKLTGQLPEGATATDLVLTVTEMLRKKGVVGKFVEYYGDGLDNLPLADRATLGNMSPEYGATCGIFPVDRLTLDYLRLTGRTPERIALVEAYAKAQGMWRDTGAPEPLFTDTPRARPRLGRAEPRRPEAAAGPGGALPRQGRVRGRAARHARQGRQGGRESAGRRHGARADPWRRRDRRDHQLHQHLQPERHAGRGPARPQRAGARPEARAFVKTSLAPGSRVVTDYLEAAGLMDDLEALGFDLVGYGCTTCIGNSGPLDEPVAKAVDDGNLVVAAVLSGNRNFEGRIHPQVKASYLASPPLVVAYALAGSLRKDLLNEPLGRGKDGKDVFLKDIWPSPAEVADCVAPATSPTRCSARPTPTSSRATSSGPRSAAPAAGPTSGTTPAPTSASRPTSSAWTSSRSRVADMTGARILALLGDSITTDHISPAGSIAKDSPAGRYLIEHGVEPRDFNSYGARRGNHEVMVRGTFANIRLKNEMADGKDGGWTKLMPDGEADDHLRRRDEVSGARRAADRHRRQGIRLGLLARLGRQRRQPARRQGGDRRELRAHPPLQPGRHGRPAADLPGRPDPPVAPARRLRDPRHRRASRPASRLAWTSPARSTARTARASRSRSPAGSTPSTRSTTSATAASCTTSCASSWSAARPPAARTELQSRHERTPARAALPVRLLRLDAGPGEVSCAASPGPGPTCRSTSRTSPTRSRVGHERAQCRQLLRLQDCLLPTRPRRRSGCRLDAGIASVPGHAHALPVADSADIAYVAIMATLNIRRLPDDVHAKLRVRAAKAGRSMEAEARMILAEAVRQPEPKPVDLAELRAFMLRLYDGTLPTGVVDDLIAERRREARRELEE